MEREIGDVRPSATDDHRDPAGDDALSAWLESLPPCPGLPYTDEQIAAADAEAEADLAAGRFYPNSVVAEWLGTWGRPDYKPFQEWLKSSG